MKDFEKLLTARLFMRDAAEKMVLAFYTERQHHADDARALAMHALVPDAPHGHEEEWLKDAISEAISDSFDVDWQPEHGADAVIDALFAHIKAPTDKAEQ